MHPSALAARLVLRGNERPSLTRPPVSVSHTLPRQAASTRRVRVVEQRFVSEEVWKPRIVAREPAKRRKRRIVETVLLTFCSSSTSRATIFVPGRLKTWRTALKYAGSRCSLRHVGWPATRPVRAWQRFTSFQTEISRTVGKAWWNFVISRLYSATDGRRRSRPRRCERSNATRRRCCPPCAAAIQACAAARSLGESITSYGVM